AYPAANHTRIRRARRLRREIHLGRTKMGGEVQWLIFKKRDPDAVEGWTLPEPATSVKTGRSIEQIRADGQAQWQSGNKGSQKESKSATKSAHRVRAARSARKALKFDKPGKDPYPRDM